MYKIKKQEKRTARQCFAILKERLLQLARSQPKLKIKAVSNQNVIFSKPLNLKLPATDQFGQPAVQLKQLSSHPSCHYPFYFQTFKPTLPDQLLTLLHPRCLLPTTPKLQYGRPNCISTCSPLTIIGTDTGYLAIITSLTPMQYKLHQAYKQIPVVSVDVNEETIVCCGATGEVVIYEQTEKGMRKVCEFVTSPALSLKIIKWAGEVVVLMCCADGSVQRVKIKKWMVITKAEVKVLWKEKIFCQKIKVMDRRVQLEHFTKSEFRDTLFFAVINARNALMFSYHPPSDKIEKLYTYVNMGNIGDKSSGILEFLYGPFINSSQKGLVLCVAFEDKMYYIKIQQSSVQMIIDNYIQLQGRLDFTPSKRMKCTSSIIAADSYGTDGLFTMVTKIGIIYYCHTSNFVTIERFTQIGQNKKMMIETGQDLHQLDTKEQIPALKGFYFYTSSVVSVKGGILLITNKQIMFCEIWDSIMLHHRLSISENILLLYYLILLKHCESVYLKAPQSFQGLDEQFPRNSLQQKQILLQYYYLVNLQPPDDFATPNQLCELLLPFILRHQLTNLSDQQTDMLVSYWQKHNHLLIEQIILSGVNKGWQIAIKNAWIRSLIKMVQMGAEYDFPVLKLYGYVVLYKDKDSMLTEKYAIQIIKYITLGISRKLKESVEDEEYQSMIQLFVKILFERDLFDVLAKVKPKKVISMLTRLFEKDCKKCLDNLTLSTLVLQCNRKYEELMMDQGSISEILYSHTFQTFLEMYPDNKQIQRYLTVQQSILIHDWTFRFKENRVFEVIISLLSDYDLLDKLRQQQIYKSKKKEEVELALQEFILDIIGYMEMNYCMKEDKRWNLVELADKASVFDYVAIRLLSPANKFQSIFAKFLNSQNSLVREKMFDWMTETMERCERGDKKILDELNRVTLAKVRFIMQINKEKTKQFVQHYYKNSEKKLINKIEQYPQLQLEYVQLVIQDSQQVQDYILNLHISLLCRLNPTRIIPVLEQSSTNDRIKYNLKEALQLCMQYKHQQAVIYINQRVGEFYASIAKHLQVFAQQWQKFKIDKRQKRQVQRSLTRTFTMDQLRDIGRHKPTDNREKDSQAILYDHLQYMLQLIHKQPKLPSYYELYSLIVTAFMKIYVMEQQQSRSVLNKGDETFLNKISDIIGVLILDLAKQGNIEFLIEQVINKYVGMHFREMKKYFSSTYKVIHSNLTLLKNISQTAKRYLINFNMQTRKGMIQSVPAESRCGLCGGVMMADNQSLLFNCGHIFHMECTISQDDSDYCGQCVFVNPIGVMVEEPDLNLSDYLRERTARLKLQMQRTDQLVQKEVEAKQQSVFQKRLNKMKIYDKRQQELVTQTQTVELRLELRETID